MSYNSAMHLTTSLLVGLALASALGCKQRDEAGAPAPGSATAPHGSTGGHHPAEALDAAAPGNPVQNEMRLLTSILQATVGGIGARDVRPIEHELHRLHAAKEATEAALHDGSYRLPKHPDQLAAFAALDDAFHKDLEALAEASHANDVPRAVDALGAILHGCEGCHATFRP